MGGLFYVVGGIIVTLSILFLVAVVGISVAKSSEVHEEQ